MCCLLTISLGLEQVKIGDIVIFNIVNIEQRNTQQLVTNPIHHALRCGKNILDAHAMFDQTVIADGTGAKPMQNHPPVRNPVGMARS
jgi:hypothetical protein